MQSLFFYWCPYSCGAPFSPSGPWETCSRLSSSTSTRTSRSPSVSLACGRHCGTAEIRNQHRTRNPALVPRLRCLPTTGQPDDELAAAIRSGASCHDGTVMRLDEIADHREAYAESAILKRKGTFILHEQLENVRQCIGRNA